MISRIETLFKLKGEYIINNNYITFYSGYLSSTLFFKFNKIKRLHIIITKIENHDT